MLRFHCTVSLECVIDSHVLMLQNRTYAMAVNSRKFVMYVLYEGLKNCSVLWFRQRLSRCLHFKPLIWQILSVLRTLFFFVKFPMTLLYSN